MGMGGAAPLHFFQRRLSIRGFRVLPISCEDRGASVKAHRGLSPQVPQSFHRGRQAY